jgi:uncharacterized lipoprotein YajG
MPETEAAKPHRGKPEGNMTMKRAITILATTLALAGCGSMSQLIENRLACVGDGEAMTISMWGRVGIASDVRPGDQVARRGCAFPKP